MPARQQQAEELSDRAGASEGFGDIAEASTAISELYDPTAFVERPWLDRAVAQLHADDSRRRLLIIGEPGTGKSTLVARWAMHWNCPRYFLRANSEGSSAASLSANAFLVSIGRQLHEKYGTEIFLPPEGPIAVTVGAAVDHAEIRGSVTAVRHRLPFLPDSTAREVRVTVGFAGSGASIIGDQADETRDSSLGLDPGTLLEEAVLSPLRRLERLWPDERVLLLIDALDEAAWRGQSAGQILDVIPRKGDASFPNNLRILMTSRPGEHLAEFRSKGDIDLDALARPDAQTDDGNAEDDARRFIERRLGEEPFAGAMAKMARRHRLGFTETVRRRAGNNFLYLRHYFEAAAEALQHGHGLSTVTVPKGLDGIYRVFAVRRIRALVGQADWDDLYRPVIGLLAVIREPVGRAALASLSGLAPERVDAVTRSLASFLRIVEAPEGNRFRLYHTSFSEYLLDPARNRDWPLDATTLHGQLADHLLADGPDGYVGRYLVHHLRQAGRIEDLHRLVAGDEEGVAWARAQYRRFRSHQAYSNDLATAWRAVGPLPDAMARRVRYAVIECRLRAWVGTFGSFLLQALVENGLRTWPEALQHVRQLEPKKQAEVLTGLLPAIPESDADAVLAAVRELEGGREQVQMLRRLADRWSMPWPPRIADEALAIAEAQDTDELRARALSAILSRLTEAQRSRAANRVGSLVASLADQKISPWNEIVDSVFGVLSSAEAVSALPAVSGIKDEVRRCHALACLAVRLDGPRRREALRVLSQAAPWARAYGIAVYLDRTQASIRFWIFLQGIAASLQVNDAFDRARALSRFLDFAPDWFARLLAVPIAAGTLRKNYDPRMTIGTLVRVARVAPMRRRSTYIDAAITAANRLKDLQQRQWALEDIARGCPPEFREQAFRAALETIDQAPKRIRGHALAGLAGRVPDSLIPEIWKRVKGIADLYDRDWAFRLIVRRLPRNLAEDAEQFITGLKDEHARDRLLELLACHPHPAVRHRAINFILQNGSELARADLISSLAPNLRELGIDLIGVARAIKFKPSKAKALVAALDAISPSERDDLLEEAIACCHEAMAPELRATLLARIAQHVPRPRRLQLLEEASREGMGLTNKEGLLRSLAIFFGDLPPEIQNTSAAELIAMAVDTKPISLRWSLENAVSGLSPRAQDAHRIFLTAIEHQGPSEWELLPARLAERSVGETAREMAAFLRLWPSRWPLRPWGDPALLAAAWSRLVARLDPAECDEALEQVRRFLGKADADANPRSPGRWLVAAGQMAQVLIGLPDNILAADENALWRRLVEDAPNMWQLRSLGEDGIGLEIARRLPPALAEAGRLFASSISYVGLRAQVLCCLAAHGGQAIAGALIEEAVHALGDLPQDRTRVGQLAGVLRKLATIVPRAELPRLTSFAKSLADPGSRAQCLAALAASNEPDLVAEAFEAALRLEAPHDTALAIAELGPNLSDAQIDRAHAAVKPIEARYAKALAYAALYKRAPSHPENPRVNWLLAFIAEEPPNVKAEAITPYACRAMEAGLPEGDWLLRRSLLTIVRVPGSLRYELLERVMACWRSAGCPYLSEIMRPTLVEVLWELRTGSLDAFVDSMRSLLPAFTATGETGAMRELIHVMRMAETWWGSGERV